MTDQELLALFRATREAALTALAFGSTAAKPERLAALHQHHATMELIEARFPGINFTHSTAEWHLQHAIGEEPDDVLGATKELCAKEASDE